MQEREVGYRLPRMMAAVSIDGPATLPLLPGKREAVQHMLDAALVDLTDQGKTGKVKCAFSRGGVAYVGGERTGDAVFVGFTRLGAATVDDWNRILSEGLGTTFSVNWMHENREKYDEDHMRVHRLGEPIFDLMASRGLNPEWDGTPEGDFTVTVVDEGAAKLALAMALHPRLGFDSALSLVSSPALIMCLVGYHEMQHGWKQ